MQDVSRRTIRLSTADDIREFVGVVARQNYNVELVSGHDSIDAKSVMGIFSFDLSNAIEVVAHTEDADEFFSAIDKFSVV